MNVELPPPELKNFISFASFALSSVDYLRHPRGVVLCVIVAGTWSIVVVVYAATRSSTRLMGTLFMCFMSLIIILFLVRLVR